jgi:hypothetical protein
MTREEHRAAHPNVDWVAHDLELATWPEMTDAQGERLWYLFFGQDK